jgi:hypothetical protein
VTRCRGNSHCGQGLPGRYHAGSPRVSRACAATDKP